jgi:hypothetical protein
MMSIIYLKHTSRSILIILSILIRTALNVITLLLLVLDALVTNRKDETLSIHETKINRLQVGVRKNEYASDALATIYLLH